MFTSDAQANIASSWKVVDSGSQWKAEVDQGCVVIAAHVSVFTSEQLPVVSLQL